MKAKICAVITTTDEAAIASATPLADLFEVRIDLIGAEWPRVARSLNKLWVATNRLASEGGRWGGAENDRLRELLKALDLGASIVDLELATAGLARMVEIVKKKAQCLISHHDFNGTPSLEDLKKIVKRQIAADADICKVVTTANSTEDNIRLLKLYREFAGSRLIAFAMGEKGVLSRVLAPLAGAEFTYASLEAGKISAPGQLTTVQLAEIYGLLKV
jgi:3-dehydroquinate dehydratase type I